MSKFLNFEKNFIFVKLYSRFKPINLIQLNMRIYEGYHGSSQRIISVSYFGAWVRFPRGAPAFLTFNPTFNNIFDNLGKF